MPALPPSVRAAHRLLDALAVLGVRDVVVAPGSRSAPLALAAAELAAAGRIDLHVRVDERDAAFLALGLARGSALSAPGAAAAPVASAVAAPVAVVTTSGTAVANLHPAVLEAHHAGVPLLLLTADRPHELRGTGANQTTEQVGIFAGATRLTVDVPAPDGRPGELRDLDHLAARAVAAARGTRSGHPGPVHLDLAYRDPLVPAATRDDPADAAIGAPARPPVVVAPAPPVDVDLPPALAADVVETVVVAGDGAGPAARALAEARGWPLLAEPSSGAASGPARVVAHPLVLGGLGDRVRRVVVLGRPTLSRPVQRLLAGGLAPHDVEVVVVAPGAGPWPDAARHAAVVLPSLPGAWLRPVDPTAAAAAWTRTWQDASAAAAAAVRAHVDTRADGLTGPQVAAEVARASTPDDVLVVGSSSPVRDLDLVAAWDEPPTVVANRGLAGIDGLVATATGVALAAARPGRGGARSPRRARALLGDLTLLHDVGGLLRAAGEPGPDLQVVVANDRGGSIFSTLEPGDAASTPADVFERVFGTPHDVDLAALCAAYGVRHVRVESRAALAAALAEPPHGLVVVEAVVDRAGRRSAGDDVTRSVLSAVRAVLGAGGDADASDS
ncbi:2-succinyl-5-enolpyruvyl-6-hydroxy-3-cyclohexene-1-carboxylic-acid synthase [Luteimicrobium subarcticum]|uniref:2-succinyl-5-enolpyruvyl-6-hydroxy-3-cyclohexene-1-carboxylate synthase n=1 Tax=Luteimicrobium subarcticum TaxID=620910 RepID=A0A2M8WVR6_9MICO|nr:2-succinyl-5-enolpyruvyl-6-hydroxy-3-cyclohexene-1-carboxylic-acid synthase [Luteimicrobium subarcticum]PJI94996.1 2-succinyl-5-enolpyruvyl-6-hydroxy-3-cyclohexene-1-carboxylate synthase [Luteimicrobium subarcticum]